MEVVSEVVSGASGTAGMSEYEELRLSTIEENRRILESMRKEQLLTEMQPETLKGEPTDTEPLFKKRKLDSGEERGAVDDDTAAGPSCSKSDEMSPEEDPSIIQHSDEVIENADDNNNNTLNDSRAKNRRKKRRREEMDELAPKIELPKNRPNFYGPVPGIAVGHVWETRMESSYDGVMRPPVAGIHAGPEGAYSIALSGSYEDDIDWGHCFTYTGEGGRALRRNRAHPNYFSFSQTRRDQELTRGNLALSLSVTSRNPVRVIRGAGLNNDYAPEYGYRYDGLYTVEKYWVTTGKYGSKIFKFLFKRCPDQEQAPWLPSEQVDEECAPEEKTEESKEIDALSGEIKPEEKTEDASKEVEAPSGEIKKEAEPLDVEDKDSEDKSKEENGSRNEGNKEKVTVEDKSAEQEEPVTKSDDPAVAAEENSNTTEDSSKPEDANPENTGSLVENKESVLQSVKEEATSEKV